MAIVDPRLPRPWQPHNTPTESDFSRLLRRLDEWMRRASFDIGELYAASGGGSATATQVTVSVTPVAVDYKEIVVVDATVTATSKLFAAFVPELDAENDVEQLIDDRMTVNAIPEAGQIRFVLSAVGAFVGDFKINYQVLA